MKMSTPGKEKLIDHDEESSNDRGSSFQSTWVKDHAAQYDFCLVFPIENGDFTKRGSGYLRSLKLLGFELFAYEGLKKDEIFVLIRTTLDKLRAFADQIDFPISLRPSEIQARLERGNEELGIAPVQIAHNPEVTPIHPYDFIFGKYSRNVDESLYFFEEGDDHPFREMVKLKLSLLILESRMPGGGENLKIRRYIRNGWLKACYPLHDRAKTQLLDMEWSKFPQQKLPLFEMKEYFGEKIALYFSFMEHYTHFLSVPAFIGIPLQIAVYITGDYSAPFLPVFSFFIALWAVFMLEFWKRKEKSIALEWGTIDFETNERDRPDFRGEVIKSFIDGSDIRYFPSKTRDFYIFQSTGGIIGLITLVVGVVVSIYVIRYAIAGDVGVGNAQTIASVANAVQIQVMNYVYSLLANALSERENHRTDTQFEDSMIIKIFVFQFVNSYASFFYIAFIAEYLGDCPDSGCMPVLAINLAIIFGSRLVTGNILELLIPYLSYQYKYRKEVLKAEGKMSRPEKEFLLEPYDLLSSSLEDYAEVAIQFGYTALFVSALPVAACFALIANIVEIRGDGWKLLNLHQRPFPKAAEDIGTWQSIFLMVSVAAVITNAGLIVFTMDTFNEFSLSLRYWIFVLFQWVCFSLQMIIMGVIPDIPEEIDIQLRRTDFIIRKLIDKVSDDNEDDVLGVDEPVVLEDYPLEGGAYSTPVSRLLRNMK